MAEAEEAPAPAEEAKAPEEEAAPALESKEDAPAEARTALSALTFA